MTTTLDSVPLCADDLAELLLGPLTAPVRLHGSPDTPGRGLAVLFWRAKVHLLTYDRGGTSGCPWCLAGFVLRQQVPRTTPLDAGPATGQDTCWQRLSPALQALVTAVATELRGHRHPAGTVVTIDRSTCAVQYGLVPPRVRCPGCTPPETATAPAFDTPPELLRTGDGTVRSRRPLPDDLVADYVAPHSLFREPRVDLDVPLPAAQIGVPLSTGDLEPGLGRGRDFRHARRTAVLEGLERYTGFHFRACTVTEASLAELGGQAIDPRTLGYHAAEQYAREDFPFAPLGDDERIRWVAASAVGGGPRRYLPEAVVTWVNRGGPRKPLFYDTSNGFALGRSREEAALHGILELVERDAFLLTWYRKLVLPELTIGRQDRALRELVDRVELLTGFRIRFYWAAMDTGIPVVVALGVRDAAGGPRRIVAAGAGLYPRAAAESAAMEVAAIQAAVAATFDDSREHAARLAADFRAVQTMEEHSLLGAQPESRPWFDFLTDDDRPTVSLAAVCAGRPAFGTVRAALDHVGERLAATGTEAYVVDVSTPELRWRDLVSVRAFVPGLLPMTFGHDTRRMDGLPRLYESVPYRSRLAPDQSPVDVPPHPFP